jgi:hypothetical protein
MYSEHGLDAVIRPVSGLVCQSLIVSSYCRPGSAHSHAAWAILSNSSRASIVLDDLAGLPATQAEGGALLDGTHELVAHADGVVGVLVLHADDVLAAEVHVEAGVAQRADLVLLARLGLDELLDVRVVDVEDDHLGRATGRATGLDGAGRGVGAAHEGLTGPEAVPPEESSSLEERMRERFRPAPEPPLKMKPSSLYQLRIESIESSTERMKQCWMSRACPAAGQVHAHHGGALPHRHICPRPGRCCAGRRRPPAAAR